MSLLEDGGFAPTSNRAGSRSVITRSLAQKPAHKDLGRNGQSPAITTKATYAPVSNRTGSRSLSITRSPAQKSACKDLSRNGQSPAITPEATYTPTSNRAGSRSQKNASYPIWIEGDRSLNNPPQRKGNLLSLTGLS
ncbi:alpha-galactosidase [Lactobacillus rhamnosus]|nr:alpha-galactosidase [Lacticaseibacillus rhamnosus]TLQ25747.1 alpha-galactosidase [Lacticaseibacillus rhamnosus]